MPKFLDLYPTLLLSFENDWISIKEIGLLNSSVCNHIDRSGFVRLLRIDVEFVEFPKEKQLLRLHYVPLIFITVISERFMSFSFTKMVFRVDFTESSMMDKFRAVFTCHNLFGAKKEYVVGSWGTYHNFNGINSNTSVCQLKSPMKFNIKTDGTTIFVLWDTGSTISPLSYCFICATAPGIECYHLSVSVLTYGFLDIDNYKNDKFRHYLVQYFNMYVDHDDENDDDYYYSVVEEYCGQVDANNSYIPNGYGSKHCGSKCSKNYGLIMYSGHFLDGDEHGKGIQRFIDGRVRPGKWEKGKFQKTNTIFNRGDHVYITPMLECCGDDTIISYINRDVYNGPIARDLPDGNDGVMSYANGDVYMGDWWQGQRHGRGSFVSFAGGVERVGQWVYDVFKYS